MNKYIFPALTAALLFSTPSQARDRLDLEGATITGNQELPKVLYIVPWKDSAADIGAELPPSLIDEPLSVIDRDVFLRHIQYFDALHGKP